MIKNYGLSLLHEQNKDADHKVIHYLITAVTDEVIRLG